MITAKLLDTIRQGFAIELDGIHGLAHWLRVRENGLYLAERTGADRAVVELFAFLHDSKRLTNRSDRQHGSRAAEFVKTLHGSSLVLLAPDDIERLVYACRYHTDGLTEADVTVQTCWDADRLDLGRVGITPAPRYLCTAAARDPDTIAWALDRSLGGAHINLSTLEQDSPQDIVPRPDTAHGESDHT